MLKKILFLLIYLFTWVLFFEVARVFFLLSTSQYAKEVPSSLIFQSLWYGLKMDISMAAYFTLLACLFVLAAVFIPFFRKRVVYFTYTGLLLFLVLFITIAAVKARISNSCINLYLLFERRMIDLAITFLNTQNNNK